MKNKLITAFLAVWLPIAFNFVQAQTTSGKITGTVQGADKKPIDGASVMLSTAKDSVTVKSVLSNPDGTFAFDGLSDNTYRLAITFVGYKNYKGDTIVIKDHQTVVLQPIILISNSKALTGVEITAQKAYIEQKIDRTVVNVNALISNSGANALEVLEKTPGVMVDENGNITFKGKSGVLVMIDDKPTYLSAANLATYLKSLPSTALDKIELMDNPPAKYDAAGNAGVINIKTKKNNLRGFNGTASANYQQGYYNRTTESLNMNYREDKVNLFTNLSYNHNHTYRRLEIDRNYFDDAGNPTSYFKDFSYFRPHAANVNIKIGADYYLSPKTTWGVVFTGAIQPDHDSSPVNSFLYGPNHVLDSTINALNTSKNTFYNGGVNVNYTHKFDTLGKVLSFDADYVRDVAGSDQTFVNDAYFPDGSLKSSQTLTDNLPSHINIYAVKSDLTIPFKNKLEFDAGVKTSFVNTDNAANYFNLINGLSTPDYNNTNRFLYKENINAAYVNLNKSWKRFTLQTGLRFENTNGDGHQLGNIEKKDSSFVNHYTNVFPTAYFSYKLDTAGHNVMLLSYGRRIGRPNYGSLNPFVFFVDKFTYFAGNPFLKPQFTDNYKVAYSYKSLFTVAFTYNFTTDYQSEVIMQNGNVFISTTGNIGVRRSLDLSVNSNLQPTKWWSVNVFAEVFNNAFYGPLSAVYLNQSATAFSGNANNQFTFSNGWGAELSVFFASRRVNGQFINLPIGALNAGLQKKILQNKGSIKLNVRDIFHTVGSRGIINDIPNATSTFSNFSDSRVATLAFTYSFGKAVNSPHKRETGSSESEQNRAH